MVALSEVTHGRKETLPVYIDILTKVVVVIVGTNESHKCCIFAKGLRHGIIFSKNWAIKKPVF